MPVTVTELAEELTAQGIRAKAFAPEEYALKGFVNVWRNLADRVPATSVYAPTAENDVWVWGDAYEHSAASTVSVTELAQKVAQTL